MLVPGGSRSASPPSLRSHRRQPPTLRWPASKVRRASPILARRCCRRQWVRCVPPSPTVVAGVPWAQQRLGPERAWELSRGRGVVVAVLDSGVSAASRALTGAVLSGVDTLGAGGADTDCEGSGTFVAALVAARPVPGVGFAGIAPQARILPVRISPHGGVATADTLANGIRAAVDRGARVVAVPATTGTDTGALRAAVAYAAARDVVVVAAGHDRGGRVAPPRFPASYPGVVAVSGIGPDGAPAETAGVPPRVDVAAPGVDVVGAAPSGRGHFVASGSWAAVGFVAGAAALVRDYLPKLTAVQVGHRLRVTADRPGSRCLTRSSAPVSSTPTRRSRRYYRRRRGCRRGPQCQSRRRCRGHRPAAPDRRAGGGWCGGRVGRGGRSLRGSVPRGRRRRWRPAR